MCKKVAIINFSTRENGNCANIGKFVSNYHEDNAKIFVIGSDQVSPCGGCNYECLTPGAACPKVDAQYRAMMDEICDSDLVYFIVPNFCGYPCASYFAYNERTVGYFQMDRGLMKKYMDIPKRFIVVSNTEGFEAVMRQQTHEEPKILYLKSGKYKKRSTAGDILDSEEARNDLDAYLRSE